MTTWSTHTDTSPLLRTFSQTPTGRGIIGGQLTHPLSSQQVASTNKRKPPTPLTLCSTYRWQGGQVTNPPHVRLLGPASPLCENPQESFVPVKTVRMSLTPRLVTWSCLAYQQTTIHGIVENCGLKIAGFFFIS